MANIIQVNRRVVYGKILFYPSCARAHILAKIAGKSTLSLSDLEQAQKLGFDVHVVLESELVNVFPARSPL